MMLRVRYASVVKKSRTTHSGSSLNPITHTADPNILVIVGTQPSVTAFSVNRATMCWHSVFFQNAMKEDRWKEGEERKVELPEDEPSVFQTYMDVMFLCDMEDSYEADVIGDQRRREYKRKERRLVLSPERIESLCKVYVLAEKLMDNSTTAYIFSRLAKDFEKSIGAPSLEAVQIIYTGTPTGNQIRKLFTEIYAARGGAILFSEGDDIMNAGVEVAPEFLLDLSKSLFSKHQNIKN
ncbi:hypothetical protein E8E13_007394 [Curvularia kusanoi]|uniref:BTB domain-containing protein n=1 Tax=Curvularia kusanoi TaxID=90978 RepID=A0A9P4TAA9_CURKU|nr:hypothetical protein E8E13_007394 [Curvularia kusanoi]